MHVHQDVSIPLLYVENVRIVEKIRAGVFNVVERL
jgi:hypothetical protein